MEDFVLREKDLSHLFVPVGSFDDQSQKSSNTEYVAAIEGVVYPWFGFAHRLDRIQFSIEQNDRDMVDHSREAIQHAQKLANFFVDEARLSGNTYFYISMEVEAMNKISNNDPFLVKIPLF